MADDMRNLAQEISSSHEARTRELHEMASALRDGLARGESERRWRFQAMMREIQARQRDRKQEVVNFLNGFRRELQGAASHWRTMALTMARKRAAAR